MSCPHLKEVRMVFCRASPVKKLVPLDQLVSQSSCETDCAFERCPAYQEARSRVAQAAEEAELVEALTASSDPESPEKGPTP